MESRNHTYVSVMHPEHGVEGCIVDYPHMSVVSGQTMDLVVNGLDAVESRRVLVVSSRGIVGEHNVVFELRKNIVGAVTQGEAIIPQCALH